MYIHTYTYIHTYIHIKPCKKAFLTVFAFVSAKGCKLICYPWPDSNIYPVDIICSAKGSK